MTKGLSERLDDAIRRETINLPLKASTVTVTALKDAKAILDRLTVDGLAGVIEIVLLHRLRETGLDGYTRPTSRDIATVAISYITAPSGELSEKGLGALPGTFIERQCADAQERSPRSGESLPDDELVAAFQQACRDWDALTASLEEDGGRGGSPMEGLGERLEELETALKRRGFDPASLVPSDSGQVKS